MWNWPYGMVCDWDDGSWAWPLHLILPLSFWAFVIAGVVMAVRYARGRGDYPPTRPWRQHGLDVLAWRYTRGEINRDEFLQKKSDLFG